MTIFMDYAFIVMMVNIFWEENKRNVYTTYHQITDHIPSIILTNPTNMILKGSSIIYQICCAYSHIFAHIIVQETPAPSLSVCY